jgi:hypothetical protein
MPKDRTKARLNAKLGKRLRAEFRENGFSDKNEYGKPDPVGSGVLKRIARIEDDYIIPVKSAKPIDFYEPTEVDLKIMESITTFNKNQREVKAQDIITLPCGKQINQSIGESCATICPKKSSGAIKRCYNLKKYGTNKKSEIEAIQESWRW